MKKKLTINDLAIDNLKARKKQYITTITGILLAMVFLSSVLFLISAFFDSTKELTNERFGKQEIIWSDTTDEYVNQAKEQGIIGKSGYGHIIGSISSTDENYYDTASVGWLDDTATELANPLLIDGTMPTEENEIAVESLMLSKMGINAKVGETITVNFKVQNGTTTFDEEKQNEYKLVGILKNKANYISFSGGIETGNIPSAFVCSDTPVEPGGKEKLVCYADFKSGGKSNSNYKKMEAFLTSIGYEPTQRAFAVISDREVMYTNDNTAYAMQETVIFTIIVVAVLMLVSCIAIINAFNSNLNERKKQIGMLRAVGATKRQIISIFGREALIISLIATPLSCAISYFVVKAIIGIMGDGYVLKPHFWCITASIVFNVVSVMLSAFIPLACASKITPVQAIKNIDANRKMKTKRIKTKKQFSVSKLISSRSLTFGKGRQAAVSLILIVAVIGSGFVFSRYSYERKNIYSLDSDYELTLALDGGLGVGVNFKNNNNGFSEMHRQMAMSNQYIDSSVGFKKAYINVIAPVSTSDYRKDISGRYNRDYEEYTEEEITSDNYEETYFSYLSDDLDTKEREKLLGTNDNFICDFGSFDSDYLKSLKSKVYDGKINIDKINSGEEIILVAPKKVTLYYDESKYGGLRRTYDGDADGRTIFSSDCDFHAGDEIEIAVITADKPTDEEGQNEFRTVIPQKVDIQRKKVKIGAIIDDIDGAFWLDNFAVITSHSVMNSYLPYLRYKSLDFNLNTTCTDEVDKSVMETLDSIADNVENAEAESDFEYQLNQRETVQRVFISMLAVIILMLSISLSIINNTITSDIRNSKQKIGTLRAVGADEKELVKSYIYQLLSMLLWGIGFGLAGFGMGYLIVYLVHKANDTDVGMIFNPIGALIFAAIVFAVCAFNLWAKIRKEMKNSIVENIRELV